MSNENITEPAPEAAVEEEVKEKGFNPKPKWFMPNKLLVSSISFMGKDILMVAEDIYIAFFNLRSNTELVYVANNETVGDGVDVISGYKTHFFAFAEKVKNARIFIVSYPSFAILVELKDTEVNRYKGLCLMESDLVAGFTGFPNYMITIWSWRTQQRLLAIPTGVIRRSQLYLASRTHILVCECWGEGLIVWEVSQCYKRCLMMRRAKEEVTGWELSEPPFVAIAWTSEGQLYALDADANLYVLASDGIGMVASVEWTENLKGSSKPCLSHYGNGLLVYGPDLCLRLLKKSEGKWKVTWSFIPFDDIIRLVANNAGDMAAAWTSTGLVYRFTGDDDKMEVATILYKQRNVINVQMIAPDFKYLATMNDKGILCIYNASTGIMVNMKRVSGSEATFASSPVTNTLAIACRVGENYGVGLYQINKTVLEAPRSASMCLTHQSVTRVVFGPTGRHLIAAAMSAGHIFIFSISESQRLHLVRYTEVGRGLADCFLMKVGAFMRSFTLVLFSDKYAIGERIVCVNAETGKDNKFAGKMQGPYCRLLPLSLKDTILAIPHLSRQYHVLKLNGDKGVTISVKMGPIFESGHDLKQFEGIFTDSVLMTFGYDGNIILRNSEGPPQYDLKLSVCHRYGNGIKQAALGGMMAATVASGATALTELYADESDTRARSHISGAALPQRPHVLPDMLDLETNVLHVIKEGEKNYLDILEDKKVREEALDVKQVRTEVVKGVEAVRAKLVALLEENIAERPLHQLSLSEFNLHLENKKERNKQAEREREETRLRTEARIRAQDKVTRWIKVNCWDTMLTPRVKLFAIFSHYQVENYAVLPSQRDNWPELQQVEALRAIETENDEDLFRPWEEPDMMKKEPSLVLAPDESGPLPVASVMSSGGLMQRQDEDEDEEEHGTARDRQMLALAPSSAHKVLTLPKSQVPQMLAHSFLHMNWMHHVTKLTVQNLRLWFNKQFDDLMNQKRREVGLVEERNNRLRFIIEELNKLSDLRGSFHHLIMDIRDPQWRQEEEPPRLVKVDPEECSIEPYISPSQIVIIPPDPGPKDDFRERALMEMMDGVLEKLWHEEIKKPIPMPQCMLDKDPEHFNEEDLRQVFDYEAKVAFRNEERDKYRKMLHAEYAKLSQLLNESVVKFNQKVKETWLTKLKIDSCIGQENLNLMRFRRRNLDRVEAAEQIEDFRKQAARWTLEAELLNKELLLAQEQSNDVQSTYDALQVKDKQMERTFKNHFADLSPIIVDQCYKFFRKRPKWQSRASMTPVVLYELATAVLTGIRPPLLHYDCVDYFKGVEILDQITNMPPVMDEGLWNTTCKLRRTKIENEIRMRGVALEMSYVEATVNVWQRAVAARKQQLQLTMQRMQQLRDEVQLTARNATVQIVLPAGQVEIITTGHMADYDDASLIPRSDIETINDLILRVGALKLRMMRRQIAFRKVILAKEWEHAQMKMKLRHMEQELYTYKRLKIPKELQLFLKNKTLGYTEEMEYVRMEKEMEASKMTVNMLLSDQIHHLEDMQVKINGVEGNSTRLDGLIGKLTVKVSEKRLQEDPLEPIRIRRVFKKRMETLVMRSNLIREVQQNHTTIVLLQTELELLRLKTFPTLATFRTIPT